MTEVHPNPPSLTDRLRSDAEWMTVHKEIGDTYLGPSKVRHLIGLLSEAADRITDEEALINSQQADKEYLRDEVEKYRDQVGGLQGNISRQVTIIERREAEIARLREETERLKAKKDEWKTRCKEQEVERRDAEDVSVRRYVQFETAEKTLAQIAGWAGSDSPAYDSPFQHKFRLEEIRRVVGEYRNQHGLPAMSWPKVPDKDSFTYEWVTPPYPPVSVVKKPVPTPAEELIESIRKALADYEEKKA